MLPMHHLQSIYPVCSFIMMQAGWKFRQAMQAHNRHSQRKKEQDPYGCQCKAKAFISYHLGNSIQIGPRRWNFRHSLFSDFPSLSVVARRQSMPRSARRGLPLNHRNSANRSLDSLQDRPWIWVPPAVMILLTILSINFIGEGLRDSIDSRYQQGLHPLLKVHSSSCR